MRRFARVRTQIVVISAVLRIRDVNETFSFETETGMFFEMSLTVQPVKLLTSKFKLLQIMHYVSHKNNK